MEEIEFEGEVALWQRNCICGEYFLEGAHGISSILSRKWTLLSKNSDWFNRV